MKKYTYTNTPVPPNLRSHAPFSGYVIVRLTDEYAANEGLLITSRSNREFNFSFLFSKMKVKPQGIERVIPTDLLPALREMEELAKKSDFPPIRSLATYWKMDYRNAGKNLDALVKNINSFAEIDIAYRELLVYDPNEDLNTPPFLDRQEYLNSATEGIDAKWVWGHTINGQTIEGQRVGLIDLEQGWEFPHQELPNISDANLLANNNAEGESYDEKDKHGKWVKKIYTGQHGINVLGIVVARDDGKGVKGIAPRTEYVKLASHYKHELARRNAPQRLNNGYIEEAIIKTLCSLLNGDVNTGDILLLEVQKIYQNTIKLPVEVELANFDAIRLASALGLIVIEAAGNGGTSLDHAIHPDIPRLLEKEDSGAVMVASAKSLLSKNNNTLLMRYSRVGSSNYGSRIDCFAPIQNMNLSPKKYVVAGGVGNIYYGTEQPDERYNNYSDDFGGTSGASAIIAGAAILLQCAYKMQNNTPLSALRMRYLLSNPNNGTKANAYYVIGGSSITSIPLLDGPLDAIGVMPNLRAIIENELISLPDLYIRKRIGDVGNVPFPSPDSIDRSPDIIVSTTRLENPFGIEGREESPLTETAIVDKTKINHIYIRVWNRGSSNAEDVKVDIYWRKVNRPIYDWNPIDMSDSIAVPQQGSNFVSFEWGNIPTRGNFYLIAIVKQLEYDNLFLPTRADNDETSFEELLASEQIFEQFVRNNNNVACFKFNLPPINP